MRDDVGVGHPPEIGWRCELEEGKNLALFGYMKFILDRNNNILIDIIKDS